MSWSFGEIRNKAWETTQKVFGRRNSTSETTESNKEKDQTPNEVPDSINDPTNESDDQKETASAPESPRTEEAKSNNKNFIGSTLESLGRLRESAKSQANQFAETAANACTRWTGRETTVNDVKKVAAVAGSIAAAFYVTGAMRKLTQGCVNPNVHSGNSSSHPFAGSYSTNWNADSSDEQHWEQDAIDYDQQQYDQLQDHNAYDQQLDSVIDDQISYNNFDY